MSGMFGDMFDMNNDGQIDSFERAMEFEFMDSLEEEDPSVGYCNGGGASARNR